MMTLAGKRVMVTGGAGFIGSHLVDQLVLKSPSRIVVVDNLFLGKLTNLDAARASFPELVVLQHDVADYDVMGDVMVAEEIDVVFHLAVVPLPVSLVRPKFTCESNVLMTVSLCQLLREGRFRTLVNFSSSEVYGTARYVPMDEEHPLLPETPYAASKAAADHIVGSYGRTFGLDMVTVRPFNGFGPRQNEGAYAGIIPGVIRRVLAGEQVVIDGDGEQTRDFTFVGDIAEAALRVYENPSTRGQVVNVSSGREVSVIDLVRKLLSALGADAAVIHGPPRPGDVRRHCGSHALAASLTGFQPGRTLDDGLEETVQWYRQLLSSSEASHRN